MKKAIYIILFFALIFPAITLKPNADNSKDITSAVEIIRRKTALNKRGSYNSSIKFSESDFDDIFCEIDYDFVTFNSIPDKESAILRLNGIDIIKGQSVPKSSLDKIDCIVFNSNKSISFDFSSPAYENGFICNIFTNESPKICECFNTEIFTYKNSAVEKKLRPNDDEGFLEIISPPKNGIIEIKSRIKGEIIYRPETNFVGRDSFTFRLLDEYGNRSEVSTARITVDKAKRNLLFVDMISDINQNACIEAVEKGLMDYSIGVDNLPVFNPDSNLSAENLADAFGFIDGESIEVYSSKSKKSPTFSDVRKLIELLPDYSPELFGDIKKSDIDFFLSDAKDENKVITRKEFAIILSKMSAYFAS